MEVFPERKDEAAQWRQIYSSSTDSQAFMSFVAEHEFMRPRRYDGYTMRKQFPPVRLMYRTYVMTLLYHLVSRIRTRILCIYVPFPALFWLVFTISRLEGGRRTTDYSLRTITGRYYMNIRIASIIDLASSSYVQGRKG